MRTSSSKHVDDSSVVSPGVTVDELDGANCIDETKLDWLVLGPSDATEIANGECK
jgi:hypothetical protein